MGASFVPSILRQAQGLSLGIRDSGPGYSLHLRRTTSVAAQDSATIPGAVSIGKMFARQADRIEAGIRRKN